MSEIKVNKITPKQNCTQVTLGDSGDDIVVASGVNLKTAAVKDAAGNVIISRCGSNITIGSSGASIALACGASQTGFGRTGTVDWDTTAKTASFTAVSGNGYFVNTTSGAITVTLPATPSPGDIVAISDYAGTAATNIITIGRNGSLIEGNAADGELDVAREAKTFIYVDGTQGWVPVNDNTNLAVSPKFVAATGGTITCCGDYKIHTFTGPGTFTVTCGGNIVGNNKIDYLVVAGGGAGGGGKAANGGGSGGGAGGFRESKATGAPWTASPLATCASLVLTAAPYPITVGAGGGPGSGCGQPGSNSIFSTITSAGGGGGGAGQSPCNGQPGGSGASRNLGNDPPVSPPQGQNGAPATGGAAGGGGGAGEVGAPSATQTNYGEGGRGGAGVNTSISGSPIAYAGGGGGGGYGGGGGGAPCTGGAGSPCGTGGRGKPVANGTANRGGGGGGNGGSDGGTCLSHGTGGSGIVIIRYKFQ